LRKKLGEEETGCLSFPTPDRYFFSPLSASRIPTRGPIGCTETKPVASPCAPGGLSWMASKGSMRGHRSYL
jgi:hypothetical protein